MRQLIELFMTFFRIGLFTFGGGLAMIPIIQKTVVTDRNWLTDEEMIDCIALAQSLPGIMAVNTATYIGNKQRGFLGAFFATLGVTMPSFIIIISVLIFLGAIGDNQYISGAFSGIRAASCALIAVAAYSLGKQIIKSAFAWIIAVVSFVLIAFFNIMAIWAIIAGALAGVIYQSAIGRRSAK